jgi:hypothetical protein
MDAGARSCLESHVCVGFGLVKSKGSCEGSRVPFKQELAHLLVDELRNKLFHQGKVVVDLLAGVRAVVEVTKTGMLSSDVLRRDLFSYIVLCAEVHASGCWHKLLLVPRDENLPGGDQDRRVGGRVGDVDRDDVGSVPGCFLSHRRPGLPDPTNIGPRLDLTHFQVVRFPGHPFHQIGGAKGLQPSGTSLFGQDGSGPSNVGLADRLQ